MSYLLVEVIELLLRY